jgi:hypothetical protein
MTGNEANVLAGRLLTSESESFIISGKDVVFAYNRVISSLSAASGTFLITCNNSEFILTLNLGSSRKNLELLLNIKRTHNLDMNITRTNQIELNITKSKKLDLSVVKSNSVELNIVKQREW